MNFNFQSYRIDFACTFENEQIVCEGFCWGEYKFLRFPVGCQVSIGFGHKTVSARIKGYTKTKCVLIVESGQEKRVSFQDLISKNCHTEISIRIEKDGFGPYRCPKTKSDEYLAWKQESGRLFKEDESSRYLRPAPEEDGSLSAYYRVGSLSTFGFSSYKQMFEWFPLSEVTFLVSQGFSVVIKQKGLDYFESLKSYKQMAMIKDQKDYQELLSHPVREYA